MRAKKELIDAVKELAEEEGVTLNCMCVYILTKAASHCNKPKLPRQAQEEILDDYINTVNGNRIDTQDEWAEAFGVRE